MSETIFAKIAKGEIPAHVVYEDDIVMAFLDISQVTKGHTLLIPKKPVQDIFAYESEHAGEVLSRVPQIARAIQRAFPEIKGMNILCNNGEEAYQTVFHSHFHLIPRYDKDNDGFGLKWEDNNGKYTEDELKTIAAHIQEEMKEG